MNNDRKPPTSLPNERATKVSLGQDARDTEFQLRAAKSATAIFLGRNQERNEFTLRNHVASACSSFEVVLLGGGLFVL
jgi:hypothetical protein